MVLFNECRMNDELLAEFFKAHFRMIRKCTVLRPPGSPPIFRAHAECVAA